MAIAVTAGAAEQIRAGGVIQMICVQLGRQQLVLEEE